MTEPEVGVGGVEDDELRRRGGYCVIAMSVTESNVISPNAEHAVLDYLSVLLLRETITRLPCPNTVSDDHVA